ncbi:hypothetical protein [Rhizobium sp. FY34]|uniref:hypothetical protein n=1 Tax=Rhizobium sp. FY34 TaxID=2562309 RepID=UPI0010BFCD2B|nr:hypothetical protein [Rhizobium sp. FY34]
MQAALIMMTILGCDDSATDCQYIATLNQRWPSIALCDSVSEKELQAFVNVSYPVVIAVCQDPTITEAKAATSPSLPLKQTPTPQSPAQERAQEQTLAQQAITRAKTILPDAEKMRHLVRSPLRLAEDGYSWVVRKLR